jgi:hypothetical protein
MSYVETKQNIISAQVPAMTRTYKPFSNKRLIDLTLEGIEKAGLKLIGESYLSAKEGNIAHGKYLVNIDDSEMQLQLQWQNSYDKTRPLVFSTGTLIKVCSNGLMRFSTMGSFKKKHQGEIQEFTPYAIGEYIKQSQDMFLQIQMERDMMKNIEIDAKTRAELIGRMYIQEQFIKSTQLNIVKREIEHPTHNYNCPNSLWELYQFTTFAMREIHPSLYIQDHLDAHDFFVREVGKVDYSTKAITTFMEQEAEIVEDAPELHQMTIFEDSAYKEE